MAGWGRLSEGGQLPNILQYVSFINYDFFFMLHKNEFSLLLRLTCRSWATRNAKICSWGPEEKKLFRIFSCAPVTITVEETLVRYVATTYVSLWQTTHGQWFTIFCIHSMSPNIIICMTYTCLTYMNRVSLMHMLLLYVQGVSHTHALHIYRVSLMHMLLLYVQGVSNAHASLICTGCLSCICFPYMYRVSPMHMLVSYVQGISHTHASRVYSVFQNLRVSFS